MNICAKCQQELKPDAAFCARCGTPVARATGSTEAASVQPPDSTDTHARLPGFSMALDGDPPTEIVSSSPAPAGNRKLVFGLAGGAALIVLVIVWTLISGGDEALKAGPQLAEPDVVASEPEQQTAVSVAEPEASGVAGEDAGLPDVLPAEVIQEASPIAPPQLPKPVAVPARPAVPPPPKQSDEDEAYLRQIRRQLEQQKNW